MKPAVKVCSIIGLLILLALAFDSHLRVVNYSIENEKIVGEVTLALITDLHSCLYGKNQQQLLQKINAVKPDLVLLGGDIFDDAYVNNNSHILIDKLATTYTTYYVSGNHEWWSKEMYHFFNYLERAGVLVLRGHADTLTVHGNKLSIGGIDDPEVNLYDTTFKSFEEQLAALGGFLDDTHFNILLAHRPEFAPQYFSHSFDLAVSGHAHGGQFRIPFLLNGFYAPNQGFFPKLAGGCYDFGRSTLIVSRGLSRENTILPRIFNRPELVFVTLASSMN